MLDLFIYLFAAYGLVCLLYLNLKGKVGPHILPAGPGSEKDVYVVVRVHNAEEKIEALARECIKLSRRLAIPHRLVILDTGSADQTAAILERLTYRYPYLGLACEGIDPLTIDFDPEEHPTLAARRLENALRQEFSV